MKNKCPLTSKLLFEAIAKLVYGTAIFCGVWFIVLIVSTILVFAIKLNEMYLYALFGASLVFVLASAIILSFLLRKIFKANKEDIYLISTFKDAYIDVETYQKGELLSSNKYYISDILFYKKTKHYFLLYVNDKQFIPLLINIDADVMKKVIENSGISPK